MLKERREAAMKVAEHLFAVEEAIDLAVTRAAELTAVMPMARVEAKLSASIGQAALDLVAVSLASLIRARSGIVEAHAHLGDAKDQIGLRELAVGGGYPKTKPTGYLEVVKADAA